MVKLRGETGDAVQGLRDPFQFQNPRPESPLGDERNDYEALCRDEYVTDKVLGRIFVKFSILI